MRGGKFLGRDGCVLEIFKFFVVGVGRVIWGVVIRFWVGIRVFKERSFVIFSCFLGSWSGFFLRVFEVLVF